MQDQTTSGLIAASASLVTAALVLVGNNILQNRAKKKDDKLRTLRELQGIRIKLKQDMITRFEAVAHQLYHEARVKYFVAHTDVKPAIPDLDLRQGERWSIKAEKWGENVTDDLAELSKTLCEISVLFRKDSKLQEQINKFLKFPVPSIDRTPPPNSALEQIDEWDNQVVQELQELAEKWYGDPLGRIIGNIQTKL